MGTGSALISKKIPQAPLRSFIFLCCKYLKIKEIQEVKNSSEFLELKNPRARGPETIKVRSERDSRLRGKDSKMGSRLRENDRKWE